MIDPRFAEYAMRATRSEASTDATRWGQIALGVRGDCQVAVDETLDGPQKWNVQISTRDVDLAFEIDSPEVLDAALQLLRARTCSSPETDSDRSCTDELEIGRFAGSAVRLLRDAESSERCFVLIQATGQPALRIAIADVAYREFVNALAETVDELDALGLMKSPAAS